MKGAARMKKTNIVISINIDFFLLLSSSVKLFSATGAAKCTCCNDLRLKTLILIDMTRWVKTEKSITKFWMLINFGGYSLKS